MKRYIYHFSCYVGVNGKNIAHGVIDLDTKIVSSQIYNLCIEKMIEIINEGRRFGDLKPHDICILSMSFLHEVEI